MGEALTVAVEPTGLEPEHTPAAVAARLAVRPTSSLADWVLGAVDGTITTFAIVAGVIGAGLSTAVVVILGVANLLADGLSMAASRYLGARAELERRQGAKERERRHISLVPEGEREEVRQILASKGFRGDELRTAVEVITRDQEVWVEFMLVEELGFAPEPDRPATAAIATFVGFVIWGLVPVAPFILDATVADVPDASMWSLGLTAAAFIAVGYLKGVAAGTRPYASALHTLLVGGSAAAVALLVGYLLRGLA